MTDLEDADRPYLKPAVEIAVRISLLALLIFWCLQILRPFVSMLLWGIIIAVAAYPMFDKLRSRFRGKSTLTAVVLTIFFLLIIIIPCALLADSLVDGLRYLKETYDQGGQLIPPPDERVKSWPRILKPVVDLWSLASTSIQSFIIQYRSQLSSAGRWLLAAIAGTGVGILQFVVSIIISGIMLAYAGAGSETAKRIFVRVIGKHGHSLVDLCAVTIRQVVKGILGVAIIQTALASVGLFAAGVPAAGLWAVLCLILAIVQIGVGPVILPLIIYMFSASDSLTATLFMVWSLFVLVSDNILKPILLGRGAPVPMLVIFLGSIGGFVALGFLGLFLGAVILSVTYKLGQQWLNATESTPLA